ncbi:DUF1007 family protein [Peteryoungia desertarenae]|uniref:DUF1007 family protein n=1 Tax=Peteryoungia desertarenae TaxID=1813451 RepID=A0ABX6QI43_9HYPH|nr:DUF1007 family protein [Peteryoungia desertarenae]QLF68169.1 DUF1007 family protein [Peteryoungia desertarenae]
MKRRLALMIGGFCLSPLPQANAHPHIFAEARLEIVSDESGMLSELRNVWRFDEFFSSSVLLDFDHNSNLILDPGELKEIGDTIRESLGDYDYFTFITKNGAAAPVAKPEVFNADFRDNQLLVFFVAKPKEPVKIEGNLSIGVYDPTLYTAIDFTTDDEIQSIGSALSACTRQVVRPDPDEVIAQNQANLTEAFFNDPNGNLMGQLFATRVEFKC